MFSSSGSKGGGSAASHWSVSTCSAPCSHTFDLREGHTVSWRLRSGSPEGWAFCLSFQYLLLARIWTIYSLKVIILEFLFDGELFYVYVYVCVCVCVHIFLGVLRLNKKSLAQSSEKQRYYYLLPKQTYLNVDEDAALTLERKRNLMYCLIVQIMKNEKEMHIDNLVFKVKSDYSLSSICRAALRIITKQYACNLLLWKAL